MLDIKFKIIEQYGILSTSKSGWSKELNLISWNDGNPKLDLREWDPDHVKMGKGVTLTEEEASKLMELLGKAIKPSKPLGNVPPCNLQIKIVRGDILNVLSNAIVLPANTNLQEGYGTSGAIFEAAGRKELTEACKQIGYCEEGKAVVTPGFALKSDYIIHTVVPSWVDGQHNEYERLCASYLAALNSADIMSCESISFPLLGSGNNGYNLSLAFDIAYQTMRQFEGKILNTAYLTIYDERAAEIVSRKGITFTESPKPNNQPPSNKSAVQKGIVQKALVRVGEFLGKKENWDNMLDVASRIVKIVKMVA